MHSALLYLKGDYDTNNSSIYCCICDFQEAEEWARRQSGPMVNPSFEPDDFLPQR